MPSTLTSEALVVQLKVTVEPWVIVKLALGEIIKVRGIVIGEDPPPIFSDFEHPAIVNEPIAKTISKEYFLFI